MISKEKLIIISNRLPISVSKQDGKLKFTQSAGGLATGLSTVSRSYDSVWIGWPGIASDDLSNSDKKAIITRLEKHDCYPVFLSQEQIDQFYSGYSNATLWPLFHYFVQRTNHEPIHWQAYEEVNQYFANESKKFITKDSLVWVHDYQLMLLPRFIKQINKRATVGFFLHTPFPSFEIFRLLPEREEILKGLMGADLVGFHTHDYLRHFLTSVLRTLGYDSHDGVIRAKDRFVSTEVFPIGIDYNKFARGSRLKRLKKKLKIFSQAQPDRKVIVSVDRADYSKGITERLDAYWEFLQCYPKYHGKVILVLLCAPSREKVEAYQELRSEIEEKISRINGKYSTVDWTPITYLHQSMSQSEVIELYSMADVMLVTPIRDGMNLVAKEYIATRQDGRGVLVLSELAGAASELIEAIQVNPNDRSKIAEGINRALDMPLSEQKRRMETMQSRIKTYTIYKWAEEYTKYLSRAHSQHAKHISTVSDKNKRAIKKAYNASKRRLILLDYDGTIVNFVSSPDGNISRPPRHVRKLLNNLSKDKKNKVVIVSGRPKAVLASWFASTDLGLAAEHGGWLRYGGAWAKSRVKFKKVKQRLKPVMDSYSDKTPGAFVEEKEFALVWHYRSVSPYMAYERKHQLIAELKPLVDDRRVGVYEGNKIIEVKPKSVHKGEISSKLADREDWDFILAMGDDYTDEDIFEALPETAFTIKVGSEPSVARFRVSTVEQAVKMLELLQT